MVGEDCQRCWRRRCVAVEYVMHPHARPMHGVCEIGQNHSAGACGSHARFPAIGLSGGGWRQSALLLRWVVSPHAPLKLVFQRNILRHPTTLLLFSVLLKILSKNLRFLGQIQNLSLIPCKNQDKNLRNNSLCFSLIHC